VRSKGGLEKGAVEEEEGARKKGEEKNSVGAAD